MERKLDVAICAYGAEGLRRIAAASHPAVEGVHYVVSWQRGGASDADIPAELSVRNDFEIHPHDTRGLARNRNHSLDAAKAPLVLIADDDISYSAEGLLGVIDAFRDNPDCQLLTFRFDCPEAPRDYPKQGFDLRRPPRGYYVCSVEIALRREAFDSRGIRFDVNFELGGDLFNCGGEDIFLHEALKKGIRGRFVPLTICSHPTITTSERALDDPLTVMTKGAVLSVLKPATWRLRLLPEAIRARRRGCRLDIRQYISLAIDGARKLKNKRAEEKKKP